MIHLPELDALTAPYAALDMEPLAVTAHLVPGTHVVAYDPIHLDGLLAWCVVNRATGGWGVPSSNDNYWIPLPLQMLWRSMEGFPLWAASTFYPLGEAARDVEYYHKRLSLEFSDMKSMRTNQGRWMERRNPVPTLVCDVLQARCIGHRETVEALVSGLAYIGKKSNLGYGEVRTWSVEPTEYTIADIFLRDGALIRPLPIDAAPALGLGVQFPDAPSQAGWTPPHWHPALLRLCYTTGTRVGVGFWDAVDIFNAIMREVE